MISSSRQHSMFIAVQNWNAKIDKKKINNKKTIILTDYMRLSKL